MVETYNNIIFDIKLLVTKKTFEEILSHCLEDNSENTNADSFQKEIAILARGIPLQNYIYQV